MFQQSNLKMNLNLKNSDSLKDIDDNFKILNKYLKETNSEQSVLNESQKLIQKINPKRNYDKLINIIGVVFIIIGLIVLNIDYVRIYLIYFLRILVLLVRCFILFLLN